MRNEKQPDKFGKDFDEEFDIIVVGYGFAGGAAAIEAADRGCSVLLAEKMPDPGGISITAGGGIRIADDADEAFAYLKASCDGRTDDAILRVFANELIGLADYIRNLAAVNDAECETRHHPGNYPYPGFDTFGAIEIAGIPGFDPRVGYPHVQGRNRGPLLFKVVEDNVNKRAIDVRLECPARRLIADGSGGVAAEGLTDDVGCRHLRRDLLHQRGVACVGHDVDVLGRDERRERASSSPAADSKPTGKCKDNTGKSARCIRPPAAGIRATASAWRRMSARTCGICGMSTARTACSTPTPSTRHAFG